LFGYQFVITTSERESTGSTITYRRDVIDFKIVREQAGYDKMGYRLFIKKVKSILFGKSSHKMTKQRCEAFFNNDDNFDLPKKAHTDKSKPESNGFFKL
jgi:hypothetical protein